MERIIIWIRANKVGLFVGAVVGFLTAKLLYGPDGMSRSQLSDAISQPGLMDTFLSSYDPQTIAFIKVAAILIIIFALIGAYTDSKVK